MSEPVEGGKKKRKLRFRYRFQRTTRRMLFAAVGVWLIVVIAIGVVYVSDDFAKPLGEPLVQINPSEGVLSVESILPAEGSGGAVPAGEPVCGGPPQMLVLLVGTDTKTDDYVRGLADTIRIVRLDFVTPSISVFAVPRALWVSVPAMEPYHSVAFNYFGEALDKSNARLNAPGTYSMLNSTYFWGNLYEMPGRGPSVLAETILVNLGIAVDHYAVVNETIAVRMIDEIGGVTINVPYAVASFPEGAQHMTGEQALAYSQTRMSDDDWHRVDRQNVTLKAVWDAMLEPGNFTKIPALVDILVNAAQTDLSKGQISSILCMGTRIDQTSVHFFTISPEMVKVAETSKGFFILIPKDDAVSRVVRQFLLGE